MTQPLDLKMSDEERIEIATTAVQQFLDNEAPWREVVEGVSKATAKAATAKAAWWCQEWLGEQEWPFEMMIDIRGGLAQALEAQGIQKPTSE